MTTRLPKAGKAQRQIETPLAETPPAEPNVSEERSPFSFDDYDNVIGFVVSQAGYRLARALDGFSVSLRPGEPARLTEVAGDPAEAGRWSALSLAPAPGFAAALMTIGAIGELTARRWLEARPERARTLAGTSHGPILEAR